MKWGKWRAKLGDLVDDKRFGVVERHLNAPMCMGGYVKTPSWGWFHLCVWDAVGLLACPVGKMPWYIKCIYEDNKEFWGMEE